MPFTLYNQFTYAIAFLFIVFVAPVMSYSIPETDIWSYLLPISL